MSDNAGSFNSNNPGVPGVTGSATSSNGVKGITTNTNDSAVYGEHRDGGIGVFGRGGPNGGTGVFGQNKSADSAVTGQNGGNGPGVRGESVNGVGVHGRGSPAGRFDGNVEVTGDVILTGADCAEEFDIAEAAETEPGTVMVLDQKGVLHHCQQAYDKKAAGVVSGAGGYRPGLILDKQQSQDSRIPIALVGKVYCKVDAQYAPIEIGDLLTTSPSHGCAMKAIDPYKAFGAVIGKALSPLDRGCRLIPILVALQ